MSAQPAAQKQFSHQFGPHIERIAPRGPLWLQQIRRGSFARFEELGIPSARLEDWKQTNLRDLAGLEFDLADASDVSKDALASVAFADLGAPRLVVVNGTCVSDFSTLGSLPKGVTAAPLSQMLEQSPERLEPHLAQHAKRDERSFSALNTAFFAEGLALIVDDGVTLDQPLHVVYVSTASGVSTASFPRTLVVVGNNAAASVIETYVSIGDGAPGLTCPVTEYSVGDNARLDHLRVQDEAANGYHISETRGRLGRDARYASLNVCLGAKLARNDIDAVLDGEGGEATLNGLYVNRNDQHVDNHTELDHAKPNCVSHELYKGILSDKARAVFKGRIIVRQDAQQTNAFQSNGNLLLSGEAEVHTRPQLEIYADDVRCSHGATIGQLREDALFYLRSRGIGKDEARRMLIHAFASELFDALPIERAKDALEAAVTERLG